MLSDVDIRKALEQGLIEIEPLSHNAIKPAGLLLHLGNELLKPRPGTVVDVKNRTVPDYDSYTITEEEPYLLNPGEFVLGHTYEVVSVGTELGFFIEGRSTLARVGLTVVQTAMIVYPGHRKRAVTLELANHGPNGVLLYPLMKIARVALFRLETPSSIEYDKHGKYRAQASVGRPVFENEFFVRNK